MALNITVCRTSDDALIIAEALSAQIEAHRNTLDHRTLFSAAFNRKLSRKVELLDSVRLSFLDHAAELRVKSASPEALDSSLIHVKAT